MDRCPPSAPLCNIVLLNQSLTVPSRVAIRRSLLQSDRQIHNTGSRFGDRSYRWVSRGSTQPTGSFDSIYSLDCACYVSGEGTSPLRRPLFIRLGNSYRIFIGIRDRAGFAIALCNQSVGPIESRPGGRSYRWVSRGSTQPTGSFDSIRSLDCACYISGEGTSPLRRPLFTQLGNLYRIFIRIRDRAGFAIALRNQSVGPIESRPGGRSYRVIGKFTIRGRDSEIAPTVGFRVAQPTGSADWWNSGDCTDVRRVEPWIEDGVNPSNSSAVVIV